MTNKSTSKNTSTAANSKFMQEASSELATGAKSFKKSMSQTTTTKTQS